MQVRNLVVVGADQFLLIGVLLLDLSLEPSNLRRVNTLQVSVAFIQTLNLREQLDDLLLMLLLQHLLVAREVLHGELEFGDLGRTFPLQYFHLLEQHFSDSVRQADHNAGQRCGPLRFIGQN